MSQKRVPRATRARRTRLKLRAVSTWPRLSVFRSGKHIYAQLIDDREGKTLLSASDLEIKKGAIGKKISPCDLASAVGALVAERAGAKKIGQAVFDRGGYQYHGRVRALAEGARKGGLKL